MEIKVSLKVMDYYIKSVKFEIINYNLKKFNILESQLLISHNNDNLLFSFNNYLGKGTTGQVYLLEPINNNNNNYVIKISNSDCKEDLENEMTIIKHYFKKNNINHKLYPIYYGSFTNLNSVGAIYPYLGYYNLEKIKTIKYTIDFNININIIIQLINQLINFKNIIHCDLKPANVVLDVRDNKMLATIIDFGLINENTQTKNVISTNYITSPESLFTLNKYRNINVTNIDLSKHDYFGLFSIVVNLFVKSSFWEILQKYFTDLDFNKTILFNQKSSSLYVYVFFRFFYKSKNEINDKNLEKLIDIIELEFNEHIHKKFLSFDKFFYNYIVSDINYDSIKENNINDLFNFLCSIIQFKTNNRLSYHELLKHKFLN